MISRRSRLVQLWAVVVAADDFDVGASHSVAFSGHGGYHP